LSVGTIEPRKNLLGAIKAMERLKWPAELVIAGEDGWKNKEVKKIIAGNPHIHYLGYVDEADKPALYQLAQGLLYPSFYEGFGLPIAEALASGCPVIAGNNSSQGEVLSDGGLLVDPYNPAEIAEAIKILMNNEGLRDNLIERGRIRAKEFSWVKAAGQVLEIFNQKII